VSHNAGASQLSGGRCDPDLDQRIFIIDWWLPQDLAITVLYVVPVLLASRLHLSWLTPAVAILTSVLTLGEMVRTPLLIFKLSSNLQSITLLVIWVTAVLCLHRLRDEARLRSYDPDRHTRSSGGLASRTQLIGGRIPPPDEELHLDARALCCAGRLR
jgi:hypothetical protein